MKQELRVLVVDDTLVYRKIVRDILASVDGVDVVGVAPNGRVALEKIGSLRPDLVVLDVEMPEVDGLEVLRELRRRKLDDVGVIMLSAVTTSGAAATTSALRLGAFDFVTKPIGDSREHNERKLSGRLRRTIDSFVRSRCSADSPILAADSPVGEPTTSVPPQHVGRGQDDVVDPRPPWTGQPPARCDIVVVGVSTGGPVALSRVLPALPADFPVPVLVVQHMPPMFTRSLADDLNRTCQLQVSEAQDGDTVAAGRVLIAPGGRQMRVEQTPDGTCRVQVTDDEPLRGCRPSVDYLFHSVAELYGRRTAAFIMTGMGDDGLESCRVLRARGARIVAQDRASCVVFGMPGKIVDGGLADAICPLDEIARQMIRSASVRSMACV